LEIVSELTIRVDAHSLNLAVTSSSARSLALKVTNVTWDVWWVYRGRLSCNWVSY